MFRDFLRFVSPIFGAIAAMPVFYPFANVLSKFLNLPFYGDTEWIAVLNSIICAFVLIVAYAYGSRYTGTLRLSIAVFLVGLICFFIYRTAIAPNRMLISLGFSAVVAKDFGNQVEVILPWYFGISACFTGSFILVLSWLFHRNLL
jgi:hypothetical protein